MPLPMNMIIIIIMCEIVQKHWSDDKIGVVWLYVSHLPNCSLA